MKNRTSVLAWAVVLALGSAACNQRTTTPTENGTATTADTTTTETTAQQPDCQPLETREAKAPEQKPTFEGQTRACAIKTTTPLNVTVLASNLEKPWAVEPLPNGDLLITEKPGRMRIVTAAGQVGQPIKGVPTVDSRGQGGLMDVALSPDFTNDRTVYWSFTEPRGNGNATSVAKGVLSQDGSSLSQAGGVAKKHGCRLI